MKEYGKFRIINLEEKGHSSYATINYKMDQNGNKRYYISKHILYHLKEDYKKFFRVNASNISIQSYDIINDLKSMLKYQSEFKKELPFEEKYTRAVNIIGLDNLLDYIPIKTKEEFDKRFKKDKYLNNVPLKLWDQSFNSFRYYINQEIRDLGINHSYSSWVCILKQACKMHYIK